MIDRDRATTQPDGGRRGGDRTRRARARETSPVEPSKGRGAWRGNGAGRGGPANGAGWGGPARGCGWGGPAKGLHALPATGPGDPHWPRKTRAQRAELRQCRTDALADHLFHTAFHAPDQMTQLNAAAMLHHIYNGSPVSRDVIATTDPGGLMSTDEIRSEIAQFEREAALLEAGAGKRAPLKRCRDWVRHPIRRPQ